MGAHESKLHKEVSANLPPEIIYTIFDLLPPLDVTKARLVCRDWNSYISGIPSLLKKIQ